MTDRFFFFLMIRRPPRSTLFPTRRSSDLVQWGDNWQERIEESLDEVTFFIPIITPGFFRSAHCQDELERFLDRRSEEHTSELQSRQYLVCRLLLEKKIYSSLSPISSHCPL